MDVSKHVVVIKEDNSRTNVHNCYPMNQKCYPLNKADFVAIRRNIMRIVIIDSFLERGLRLSKSGKNMLNFLCDHILHMEKPKHLDVLAHNNISRLAYYLFRKKWHKRRCYRHLRLRLRKHREFYKGV